MRWLCAAANKTPQKKSEAFVSVEMCAVFNLTACQFSRLRVCCSVGEAVSHCPSEPLLVFSAPFAEREDRTYDLLCSDAIKEWGIKTVLPFATTGCFPLHFKMDKSGVTVRYSSVSVLCEFTTAAGLIVVLMVKSAWLTTDVMSAACVRAFAPVFSPLLDT